ncbi:hypothetical protein BDV26DRAFT_266938 [Aspergillus bertholletiae]|uniref:Armadillo-type protein n=1 Tax=Aspergillus bertholletiae TaxID=1226010 RepID=A0A5N7B1I2_9EURO|nr:hypothetical protein BDV26DRAFT_266938 [Aspergillus bertholletiae]
MEELRRACREALLQRHPTSSTFPEVQIVNIAVPEELDLLWQAVAPQGDKDNVKICEDLLVAYNFLKVRSPKDLSGADEDSANHIFSWASDAALPSPVHAQIEEPLDEKNDVILEDQLRSRIALSVLATLAESLPIFKAESAADIIIALASFSSTEDPWTTQEAFTCATSILNSFASGATTKPELSTAFWSVIEKILKDRIRPLFAKTRNPAITSAGRKDFHPIPLPRFDASLLDPETKPWKIQDIYAPTVLSWIIQQYKPTNQTNLETHFPLLVPPILALIDDDTTAIKAKGCTLFRQLLTPIQETKSPILHRTNLTSVFEDALKPCLLSLPTITPEPDSISLLKEAYPALITLQKTSYTNTPPPITPSTKQIYISRLTTSLRENLIPAFHHISSTNTTSPLGDFASFPYPRLSTLVLDQMVTVVGELGIHTTKFLQDIVPLVHSTLANPFGPAYSPMLLAAAALARVVVLNAHPRVWRWRGELLDAVCSCWIHVVEEEREIADRGKRAGLAGSSETEGADMERLKKELRGVVYLVKFALNNSSETDGGEGQLEAKEKLEKELRELVNADETLHDLLLEEIDANDGGFFGEA